MNTSVGLWERTCAFAQTHLFVRLFLAGSGILGIISKKKIDKSIDFLRGWEEKRVSIFRLRSCGKVGVSLGPNGAVAEIHT